jgi:hypothetical protein
VIADRSGTKAGLWAAGVFLVLAIGYLVLAILSPETSRYVYKFAETLTFKVLFLSCLALIVVLQSYWKLRGSIAFWGILALFLTVFALTVASLGDFRNDFLVIGLIGAAEFGIFALVLYRVFGVLPRPQGGKRS